MRTAVALGSNLGDRLGNLRAARSAIFDLSNVKPPLLSSALYETDPVGCEPGAAKFLNAVLEFDYQGDPVDLLTSLREIESVLGRPPNHPRNVSRQIDIDILYVGNTKTHNEELQLPHPRMHSRKFVLQPLAEIRGDLVLQGQRKTVRALLEELEEPGEVVSRLRDDW